MTFAVTVAQQVFVMFVLIFLGLLAYQIRMIDRTGVKQITDILLYFVTPAVIFSAFMQEKTPELLRNLLISFGLAILSYLVAMLLAYLFIRRKNNPRAAVERFAVIYPNNGFMGIPLVAAVLGTEGVFYAAAFICIGNVFAWTHGVLLMSRNRSEGEKMKLPLSQILLSPALIAFVLGLIVFVFSIPIHGVALQAVNFMGALNTPVAMLVVGATLAQTNILSAFKSLRVYGIVFLTNVVTPVVMLLLSSLFSLPDVLLLNNIILCACPSAAMTIIFAEKYNNDAQHATKVFTLSNLATILTLPAIILLTEWFLR